MLEVPLEFAPSPAQEKVWARHIMVELGIDIDGWFMGWCPLHDKTRDPERSSAQFNFMHGVMRCEAEAPCHAPKRSMSLQNVLTRMATTDG